MLTFSDAYALANTVTAVEESTSYGTPALKIKGKLIARLLDDQQTLVLRCTWEERERLLTISPEAYFLTEHYRKHPWVLLNLAVASELQLSESLKHACQQAAAK
jgi:hypothetical protein